MKVNLPLLRRCLTYDSSAVTGPSVAVSTVRACADAPAGTSSAAANAALASQPNVVRRRRPDTVVSVEERHRLAHLENTGTGPVTDVLAECLGVAHVSRDEKRPPVLV